MNITLYLDPFYQFLALPPDVMLMRMMLLYAWIPIAYIFMWGIWQVWANVYLPGQWASRNAKYTFLAIDVPKGNEQSPKAVENMFTYFAGAHSTINLIEKYWEGKFQQGFSFEVACIEGYTQFIIRTPVQFKNMTESAVYSVYPDAEITEVADYTTGYPKHFPNDEYDVWGAEFILAGPRVYPFKTYKEFEHQFGKPEGNFRDPMAALMDLCSTLRKGEQLWWQIIIVPIPPVDWTEEGKKEISKILGEKSSKKPGVLYFIAEHLNGWFNLIMGITSEKSDAKDETLKMINLKPEQKKRIENIQLKVSQVAFEVKNRMVYMARKEVKNNPKVVNGFVGFMKQFTYTDLNNIKPDTKRTATSASYFMKESRILGRKNRVVRRYMSRDSWEGRLRDIYTIEELATLWHLPIEYSVHAPLIQKTPGRKAEPPVSLPIGEEVTSTEQLMDEIFAPEVSSGKVPSRQEVTTPEQDFASIFNMEDERPKAASAQQPAVEPESAKQNEPEGRPPDNLPFV
jgi:hypothetical protein